MITVYHKQKNYLIGFKKLTHARSVHYSIHMNPKPILLRDTNIDLHKDLHDEGYDMHLTLDVNSMLFIPKNHNSVIDPIYDACISLNELKEVDFLHIPVSKNTGIVMPYELIDENDEEFMFRSYVIDPYVASNKR